VSPGRDIRSYATFLADVPDDQVEEGGEVVTPGGATVAELLRGAVAERGLTTTPVRQHSFYGWAFDVSAGEVTVECMIQFPDPWLLITEVSGTLLGRIFRRRPRETHDAVLNILRETLVASPFRSAAWMTRTEYETSEREKARR
jgi:hypothetical protein